MIVSYGHYCCVTGNDILHADVTVKENNINSILSSIHQIVETFPLIKYESFDKLPFINRSLICTIKYYNDNRISTLVQTALGCENSCIFCQRKSWQSHYIEHSYDYVLAEFEELYLQNFKNIWITDENFTFHLQRAKNIIKGLAEHGLTKNMKIAISSWANIDEDFLILAVKANIKTISFGIETGNDNILKFYRKNISLSKAKHLIKYANELGIFTVGNFIIGAPMETKETISETFSFINECAFDQINIKTLDYMIGSELYSSIGNDIIKGKTHMFASKENGLNSFPIEEMEQIKRSFLEQYYKDNQRKLKQKIAIYGTPFVFVKTSTSGA